MVLVPLLMGASYLAIAYPRFCGDLSFIWEHLLVLAVWVAATAILMYIFRELLIRVNVRLVFLPAVILPALSCYLLFVIYTVALLGDFFWGALPTYRVILKFGPHLFELADNFGIPRAFVVSFFALPFFLFLLIFQGRIREMIVWHWSLREGFMLLDRRRRWTVGVAFSLTWMSLLAVMVTADSTIEKFGNFSHDPVVRFFKTTRNFFPMTQERVYWAGRDEKAKRSIRRYMPKVHNVFLFVVDALRADHLPLYGYPQPLTPFLSKFLKNAHSRKVDLALSNGLDTITGLQCLLTSKEPMAASQLNYTLPDYLSDQGFRTYLILAGGHGWQKASKSFGKKIDFFYDGSEHPGPDGICDDRIVLNELSQLPPDDGGYHFFYIHIISVHQLATLWNLHPPYEPCQNIVNLVFNGSGDEETLLETKNMYDDRILQMDGVLQMEFSILAKKGYLHDYVAVLTGDHGQLLGEKGHYGHGFYAALGGMRIPMVFFGSKPLPPLAQSRFGVQVDIAPTLAEMAGVSFPSCWQGQSLLHLRANPWSYHCSVQEWQGREGAVVYGNGQGPILKFSRPIEKPGASSGRLYDLEKDPEEKNDLIGLMDPRFLAEMRSQADEYFLNN